MIMPLGSSRTAARRCDPGLLHLGQDAVLRQPFDGGDLMPSAELTGIEHERTAPTPSMCTVQARHCAMPQPYFVPVRPICSRITHNKGVLDRPRCFVLVR